MFKVANQGNGEYKYNDQEVSLDKEGMSSLISTLTGADKTAANEIVDSMKEGAEVEMDEANTEVGTVVDVYEVHYPKPADPMKETQEIASHLDEYKDFVTQYLFPGSNVDEIGVGLTPAKPEEELIEGVESNPQEVPLPKRANWREVLC